MATTSTHPCPYQRFTESTSTRLMARLQGATAANSVLPELILGLSKELARTKDNTSKRRSGQCEEPDEPSQGNQKGHLQTGGHQQQQTQSEQSKGTSAQSGVDEPSQDNQKGYLHRLVVSNSSKPRGGLNSSTNHGLCLTVKNRNASGMI